MGFTQGTKETENLWHEDKAKLRQCYAASLPHSKACYYNRHSKDNKNEPPNLFLEYVLLFGATTLATYNRAGGHYKLSHKLIFAHLTMKNIRIYK
jgi:hypothetical protein